MNGRADAIFFTDAAQWRAWLEANQGDATWLVAAFSSHSSAPIILATDDDLANLEVALDARRINPGIRVVLRMFDQNMADKIRDGFNIYTAMSQSAISAPAFATAALDRAIVNSFMVNDALIVMQRWIVRGIVAGALKG